ncbi:bifunctional GNAT family N-acetyltransferase/acetate--CoA ligase family protein [soil metagenome]
MDAAEAGPDNRRPDEPQHWEADVLLSDGGTMHVRPMRPDDGERLVAFHNRQSAESIYLRFFSPRPRLSDRDVERFTHVDYRDRMAFIGLLGDEMVGVARYDRWEARDEAEVAFFVDDAHQSRGMATVLLEYLAAAAREVGIRGFTAQVLPHNRKMLSVFKQVGFSVASHFADGVVEVRMGIEPTDESLAAMADRARRSEIRSVARLLAPRSIAVIGAGRRPGTIGHDLFRHLIEHRFEGPVYAVNAHASHVSSAQTWPSVLDVPGDVDLAVIAVPAPDVVAVVEECARKRVQGLVIISAGFAETGAEGLALERRVVEVARGHGMRLIGPNCMGVINTDPAVTMHATFADVHPAPGRVALSSQSGTLGAAILQHVRRVGLGISTFVAVGNKADVSGNDLLQFWEEDEATDVVLLYLESFGNPRNFSRIARRLSRSKPIVAVKSGRSLPPGDAPSADRTVGWPRDATIDAMLRQTGVIRVDTLEQLFDVARVLTDQPLPRGRRVAIVSNSWGPALLAADACLGAGLELVTAPSELTHGAGPEDYATAIQAVLADDGVDAVLVLFAPPVPSRTDEVARAIATAVDRGPAKTVVATMFGTQPASGLRAAGRPIPAFDFPESAAHALGRVARYGEWRTQPSGVVPEPDPAGVEAARSMVAAVFEGHPSGRQLDRTEAATLLGTHGIVPVAHRLVASADDAVAAAAELGHPVAIKATGLPQLAKTEAGGLAVDVHGDDEVRGAYERMVGALGDAMRPALVQVMAPAGIDCAVGVHQDAALGSVMTFGLGGVNAAALDDVCLRVLPLTDLDAAGVVAASRVGRILVDAGEAAVRAAQDLLLRLAALADAVPELALVECNPVIVSEAGAVVTDTLVQVTPWDRAPAPPVRRLS